MHYYMIIIPYLIFSLISSFFCDLAEIESLKLTFSGITVDLLKNKGILSLQLLESHHMHKY